LIDNKQIEENEKAVLVGVMQQGQNELQVKEYLEELAFLAETGSSRQQNLCGQG